MKIILLTLSIIAYQSVLRGAENIVIVDSIEKSLQGAEVRIWIDVKEREKDPFKASAAEGLADGQIVNDFAFELIRNHIENYPFILESDEIGRAPESRLYCYFVGIIRISPTESERFFEISFGDHQKLEIIEYKRSLGGINEVVQSVRGLSWVDSERMLYAVCLAVNNVIRKQ